MTAGKKQDRRVSQRVLTVAVALVTGSAVAVPAGAQAATIRPGSSIVTGGSYCTLNWVYDEVLTAAELEQREPRVFVGTAGHCVDEVGQEVSLAASTFGEVTLAFGEVAYLDDDLDYAFVEIHPDHHDLVDAAMKGHPDIPTGVSTRATAAEGDTMQFSGNGAGFHLTAPTREERIGILNFNDGVHHNVTGPVVGGDSGGPVADLTDGGKAFGIVTTVGAGVNTAAQTVVVAGEGGLSLEGLLADADAAGWTVEVRTVGDDGLQAQTDTVSIDDLAATVDGEQLVATGTAAWGGGAVVATDPAGDATVAGSGTDFVDAIIEQPQGSDTVSFSLRLADPVPAVSGIPEVVSYGWPLTAAGRDVTLNAWRTATSQPDGSVGQPWLTVQVCEPVAAGGASCTSTPVAGAFADGTIRFDVPLHLLDAGPGDTLTSGDPIYAAPGVSGRLTVHGGPANLDEMTMAGGFTLPGRVDLELVDDAGQVAASSATDVDDGGFRGSIDTAGLASGDYTLRATTCYGPAGSCATAQATVSLP